MYKIIGLALVVLVSVFSNLSYADNSKYCALMQAIYGVCSDELIENYLIRIAQPETPRLKLESAKPPVTIVPSVTPLNTPEQVKEEPKTEVKPCWYYTPAGWKKCRFVG